MPFPQIIDYNEAVQDPPSAFADYTLQSGRVATTPLGLPLALSGGFALTYTVSAGGRKYAVRCFHREVPEAQSRYAAISTKLRALSSPYFVNFEFQPQGIRIRGQWYPIVKMDWADGETLGEYLNKATPNPSFMASLRRAFTALAEKLEAEGIAHGDLQNENVIVQNGAIRLIDYDGMFVQGMPTALGSEIGQKNFQHPSRTTTDFGPTIDRFSFIAIDVSLQALQADASLHRRFREGGQAIIFKANDYVDPGASEVFAVLRKSEILRESAQKFEAVCRAPISATPSLADFVAGRNIPAVVLPPPTPRTALASPSPLTAYIGAYPVVNAQSYSAVAPCVGQKVELIGRITSVKLGSVRRGKHAGSPYVFINFGIWNADSVKITIWSEGLTELSSVPSAAWTGRWVSVTGLIEPPYHGSHYGKSYTNVGITVTSGSQIIQLKEDEAKFRLGFGKVANARGAVSTTTNAQILQNLGTTTRRPPTAPTPSTRYRTPGATIRPLPPPPPSPLPHARTRNEEILRTIKAQAPPPSPSHAPTNHGTTGAHRPPSQQQPSQGVPGWVWWVGGLVALSLLSQCGGS